MIEPVQCGRSRPTRSGQIGHFVETPIILPFSTHHVRLAHYVIDQSVYETYRREAMYGKGRPLMLCHGKYDISQWNW